MPDITCIFNLLDDYKVHPHGNDIVFTHTRDENTFVVTGKEYLDTVDRLALALLNLDIKKGDTIATVLTNRPEWNYFDMAMLSIGAIQVPVYPTSGYDNCSFIFENARISMLVIENEDLLKRMKRAISHLPDYVKIVTIDKIKGYRHWESILPDDNEFCEKRESLDQHRKDISENDIASVIYTSGTTGDPKGVMLSHKNFVSNFIAVSELMRLDLVKAALSFLPLCHVYERMLNYMYQHLGIIIHYGRGIDYIKEDILRLKPNMICVVPRVLEKIYMKIWSKGHEMKWIKRIFYYWALNIASRYKVDKRNTLLYRMRYRIADRIVYSGVRKSLGGDLNVIISGGAALHPKLLRTFTAFGFFVLPGYGLTETAPVVAVTTFEKKGIKEGTVGPILKGVSVKIAEDNEILVKGPNVMQGYYNNPEKTREVIDEDGWFHTGDTGEIIHKKFLKIKDRKNEIFKTSGGKYVSPQAMENKIRESAFIENIMIFGEKRKFPSAIIAPNFEHLESWAKHKEIQYDSRNELITNATVQHRIAKDINDFSDGFDEWAKVKKFILTPQSWTPESGFLTPTLKPRRKFIEKKYRKSIEKLYKD